MLIYLVLFTFFCLNTTWADIANTYKNGDLFLERVNFDELNNWKNENFSEALNAFIQNCNKLKTFPRSKNIFPQTNKNITKSDFAVACKLANILNRYEEKHKKMFFEKFFIPYKVIKTDKKNNLFTGYYIPLIKAKRKKDSVYKYPIYKKPDELIEYKKYYTRRQINNGILANRNLEILYTNDPIDLFFVHTQGSANVYLVDERKIISICYDGKNNHDFASIGNFLLQQEVIDRKDLNAKRIKYFLKQNMDIAESILNVNKSYIFFRLSENKTISGTFGTELIPYRTIAVDTRYIPLGFPLWLSTKYNANGKMLDFNKIVLSNDTGSAIKGNIRGDIFFGYGKYAEDIASAQHYFGEYFLLLPKQIAKKL